MDFKNGVINIQAAGYYGAPTVELGKFEFLYYIIDQFAMHIVNFPSRRAPIKSKHTCIGTILTCFFILTINLHCGNPMT